MITYPEFCTHTGIYKQRSGVQPSERQVSLGNQGGQILGVPLKPSDITEQYGTERFKGGQGGVEFFQQVEVIK